MDEIAKHFEDMASRPALLAQTLRIAAESPRSSEIKASQVLLEVTCATASCLQGIDKFAKLWAAM